MRLSEHAESYLQQWKGVKGAVSCIQGLDQLSIHLLLLLCGACPA